MAQNVLTPVASATLFSSRRCSISGSDRVQMQKISSPLWQLAAGDRAEDRLGAKSAVTGWRESGRLRLTARLHSRIGTGLFWHKCQQGRGTLSSSRMNLPRI